MCVRVCVLYSEGVFFSLASGLTLRDAEMNPVPLPGFYSLRYWGVSHCLASWLWLCVCVCVGEKDCVPPLPRDAWIRWTLTHN